MPIGFDYRQQLYGPWDIARGFLVEQFDRLYASLGPLGPLLDGLSGTITQAGTAINPSSRYASASVLTTDANGAPAFTSTLPMPLAFALTVTLTPSALTADTNNYTPTGLAAAAIVRLSSTGSVNLTGLQSVTGTSTLRLLVNAGANNITLTHADASSAAGNRWRCPGAANLVLSLGRAVWIWYDTTSAVWQVIG
jgi:hypothetical protein